LSGEGNPIPLRGLKGLERSNHGGNLSTLKGRGPRPLERKDRAVRGDVKKRNMTPEGNGRGGGGSANGAATSWSIDRPGLRLRYRGGALKNLPRGVKTNRPARGPKGREYRKSRGIGRGVKGLRCHGHKAARREWTVGEAPRWETAGLRKKKLWISVQAKVHGRDDERHEKKQGNSPSKRDITAENKRRRGQKITDPGVPNEGEEGNSVKKKTSKGGGRKRGGKRGLRVGRGGNTCSLNAQRKTGEAL